jgi:hypothetical protein
MRVMLMVPKRYGLFHSFTKVFSLLNAEIFPIDYFNYVNKWEKRLNVQVFRLPEKMRLRWESYYLKKINDYYRREYDQIKPDLVFIYNNEHLLPETLAYFSKKSKIAFFLGDHPLYTSLNRYYLSLLDYADAIYAPDYFWIRQLEKMGLKNLHHFCPGIPEKQYFQRKLPPELFNNLKSEVLYIGMCYTDNWGFKKAKFLNHFTSFDLQIHGNRHWKRWFDFFPELEGKFKLKDHYYSEALMNNLFNATKIIPIDGNPGVLTGVHFRMFEALGAGALPLLEWQDDLSKIFPEKSELPAPKTYDEIKEMTHYYLNNETKRQEKVDWMKKIIQEKYSPENNAKIIYETLAFD